MSADAKDEPWWPPRFEQSHNMFSERAFLRDHPCVNIVVRTAAGRDLLGKSGYLFMANGAEHHIQSAPDLLSLRCLLLSLAKTNLPQE